MLQSLMRLGLNGWEVLLSVKSNSSWHPGSISWKKHMYILSLNSRVTKQIDKTVIAEIEIGAERDHREEQMWKENRLPTTGMTERTKSNNKYYAALNISLRFEISKHKKTSSPLGTQASTTLK